MLGSEYGDTVLPIVCLLKGMTQGRRTGNVEFMKEYTIHRGAHIQCRAVRTRQN